VIIFERGENNMICLIYGENKIISELIEKQFKCECDSSCQVCVNKTMVKCCDCGREISLAKAYIYIDEYDNKFYCKSCFSMLIAERFCKEIQKEEND
jgi:hypothetical protein